MSDLWGLHTAAEDDWEDPAQGGPQTLYRGIVVPSPVDLEGLAKSVGRNWTTDDEVSGKFSDPTEYRSIPSTDSHRMRGGEGPFVGVHFEGEWDGNPESVDHDWHRVHPDENEIRVKPGTPIKIKNVNYVYPEAGWDDENILADGPRDFHASTDGIRYAARRWVHVSPHEIEPGTVLTPGGGKSVYDNDENSWYNAHDEQDRRNWVWLDTHNNHANWVDTLMDDLTPSDGSTPPPVHAYEVQPHEAPWEWGEGGQGYVVPAATVVKKIKTYRRDPDDTDGIRYAHVVEADVAEDLMRLGYINEDGEEATSGTDLTSIAEQLMMKARHTGPKFHIPKATVQEAKELGLVDQWGAVDTRALQRQHAAHAEKYVNDILQSHGHPGGIRVVPAHWDTRASGGLASTDGHTFIGLQGTDTNALSLLHETAHILARTTEEDGHGPDFQQLLHGLYRDHISPHAANLFASVVGLNNRTTHLAMPMRDAYDYMISDSKRLDDNIPEHGTFYHGSNHEHQPGDILTSVSHRYNEDPEANQERMDYYTKMVGAPNHADWVWMYNHPAPATKYMKHVYEVEPMDEGPWIWNNIYHDDGTVGPLSSDSDFPRLVSPRARVVRKLTPEEHAAAVAHMNSYYDSLRSDNSRLAMAWQDWAPQIQGGCKGCSGGGDSGHYYIAHDNPGKVPGDDWLGRSSLNFYHDTGLDGKPELYISGIHTNSAYQKDGVAESLIRHLHDTHPDMRINPGFMTGDGQAFHDKMLQKEPSAKSMMARLAAVNQGLVDRLHNEFHDWWKNTYPKSLRNGDPHAVEYQSMAGPDFGPIAHWPNIEAFLKEKYPAAHRNLNLGLEQAKGLLDDTEIDWSEIGHTNLDPYETGPEALAKHGYDPKEIAAGMLLLHNESDPLRGDMSAEDQARLNDIFDKRVKMQRNYEQRNASVRVASAPFDPQAELRAVHGYLFDGVHQLDSGPVEQIRSRPDSHHIMYTPHWTGEALSQSMGHNFPHAVRRQADEYERTLRQVMVNPNDPAARAAAEEARNRTRIELQHGRSFAVPDLSHLSRISDPDDDSLYGPVNPRFDIGLGGEDLPSLNAYKINCQRCVLAAEMRAKGYNVEARPNYRSPRGGSSNDKSLQDADISAFYLRHDGLPTHYHDAEDMFDARDPRELWDHMTAHIAGYGPGARAGISVSYGGEDPYSAGPFRHMLRAHVDDGGNVIYSDPQKPQYIASNWRERINHGLYRGNADRRRAALSTLQDPNSSPSSYLAAHAVHSKEVSPLRFMRLDDKTIAPHASQYVVDRGTMGSGLVLPPGYRSES